MVNPKSLPPINPHFFQPLLPGFRNYLSIPVKFFVKHIEGKSEDETAKLRSDVSYRTWEVKMDGRRLTDGWKTFAADNGFRVGDIIVFRHEGNLVFHVTGFGPSCCNLQYDLMGNVPGENEVKKSSRTEAVSCFVAPVTVSNLRIDSLFLPTSFAISNGLNDRCCEIVLMNEHGRSWTLNLRNSSTSRRRAYIRRGWRSFCHENGRKVGSFCTFKLVGNGARPVLQLSATERDNDLTPEKYSGANKMEITSEKRSSKNRSSSGECSKRKAKRTLRWKVSSSPMKNRCFTLTISPSILRFGWFFLPIGFTKKNGITESGKIILLDKNGVEWPVSLWMERKNGKMGLGKGLRGFFRAIRAKEGDSFVLQLDWRDRTPVLKFCSEIYRDTKSADHETVGKDTDRMAKAEETITEIFTADVLVKEESLETSGHAFSASECGYKKRLRAKGTKNDSEKGSRGREEERDSERRAKKRSPHWKASSSPRQNRLVTLTLAPYCLKRSELCLPRRFTSMNGIKEPREIILMGKDGERWKNKLVKSNSKTGKMGLGKGWKGFCEANRVKTGESFRLKLSWEDTTPVLKFCSKINI